MILPQAEREEKRRTNAERQLAAAKEALGLCQAELDAVQEELSAAHAQLRLRGIPEEEEKAAGKEWGSKGDGGSGERGGSAGLELHEVGSDTSVVVWELTRANCELTELNNALRREVLDAAKSAATQVRRVGAHVADVQWLSMRKQSEARSHAVLMTVLLIHTAHGAGRLGRRKREAPRLCASPQSLLLPSLALRNPL